MYQTSQSQGPMYMSRSYSSNSNLESIAANSPRYSASAAISQSSSTQIHFASSAYQSSSFTKTTIETPFYTKTQVNYIKHESIRSYLSVLHQSNFLAKLSYDINPAGLIGAYNSNFLESSSLDIMNQNGLNANNNLIHIETDFNPISFIKPRSGGIFVAEAKIIEEQIKDTFERLMGEEFPSDIKVSVLKTNEFRKLCPHPGVVGLSYNRRSLGLVSEIFVLEGSLASVMLTIGHEIGHVLTKTLNNPALEEAKAYSFSFAWMEMIRKFNIAGLASSFVETMSANNGIHDLGYNFVQKLITKGRGAFEVYRKLVMDEFSKNDLVTI